MINGYYAGIDIGTNAVRLVIKNVTTHDGEIESYQVQEVRVPLRLGVDVFKSGAIGFKKEEQLVKTMDCFRKLMEIYGVIDYRAFATSAMREATNSNDIIWRIRKETGIDVKIISGEHEASTISKIAEDFDLEEGKWVFVDVGGGSTEITLVIKGKPVESHSFRIGTLRLLAGKVENETWRALKRLIGSYYDKYGAMNIVGTGGNINRYWKMSSQENKKGRHIIYFDDLKELYKELNRYSTEERMQKFKLKPDRADVIIPAGDIFITIGNILETNYIVVPMTGLGDGIVDSLVDDNQATNSVI